jgi:hypothetical protein
MKTETLIAKLAADAGRRRSAPDGVLVAATASAVVATVVVFAAVIGSVRPDLTAALGDPRFLAKLAITVSLAIAALPLLRALVHPGASLRWARAGLILPAVVGLAAVAMEFSSLPQGRLLPSLLGGNGPACLAYVAVLGLVPLALFLLVVRHGAPTRPRLAGAAAGLLAGAVAATAYAIHCPDDSPLFVVTWYTFAIAALALAGAGMGRLFARW